MNFLRPIVQPISNLSLKGEYHELLIDSPDTLIHFLSLNCTNTNVNIKECIVNEIYLGGSYSEENTIKLSKISLRTFRINENFLCDGKFIEVNQYSKMLSEKTVGEFYSENKISDKDIEDIQLTISYLKVSDESHLFELKIPEGYKDELWKKKYQEVFIDFNDENRKSSFFFNSISAKKIKFLEVDFSKFQVIRIENTDFSSAKMLRAFIPYKQVDEDNYHALYEVFNSLYSSALANNNARESIEYFKASQLFLLKSHFKINTPKWINRLLHLFKHVAMRFKNLPSVISLLTAKIYSSFGTNWMQAILVTLVIGFCSFSIMMLSTEYDISLTSEGWDNFKKLSVYYIQFIDPTHKLSFMDGINKEIRFSTQFTFVLFDFIGRILTGIGIYETVVSFRKYVRK
jgi:hypothetical protein